MDRLKTTTKPAGTQTSKAIEAALRQVQARKDTRKRELRDAVLKATGS